MPAVVAKGAIIVVSVAVAAAIAVYESPQARQFAEDLRRRIAIALHSLGDEINPASQQPRFNRPEDADGFLQSQGAIAAAPPGVEADEESARRQREELMYWNAVRMEKLEKARRLEELERPKNRSRGSSFEDFLQQDAGAAKGTFVYNTGADVNRDADVGLRNRGVSGLQRGSVYANPFGDEHNIDMEEQRVIDSRLISPDASERFEVMSEGLYSANDDPIPSTQRITTRETTATIAEQLLVDTSEPVPDPPIMVPEMEEPWQHQESMNFTNMAPRDDSAYASIHAWADNANHSFYSPLPATPRAGTPRAHSPAQYQHSHQGQAADAVAGPPSPTFSDPAISVPGSGELTPTTEADSMSLAGSGDEVWAPRSGATSEGYGGGEGERDGDVISVDGEGISTPGSWTEVGSVVSESDAGVGAAVHH